ncbi:centrosomal AT-AC splicing factor isoform X1 [Poecile atricapillus]|uniref:centrosomal AT-AC splicing factor isoform X1 n=1 Tax=Poecile atricapillus TaxID=48891 RepID=UPI0027396D98|nr:centrosomal AT-AC splicing factor isoform X1 [Poecile atricapillus]
MAVHYCGLCRRSAFTGRRHLYSVGHRRRLQEALAQLQEATAAARAAAALADGAAAVRRYDPAEHDGRVWCPCCGRGVRRDGRRGGLALLQAGLMRHLAGPEHRRETARFWRENRAEAALRERCLVPAEEYERFAQALERALAEHQRREEERILQMAADIREAERRQRETVQAALQLQPEPELCAGPSVCRPSTGPEWDSTCAAEQPGPSGMQTGTDLSWTESGMVLTFIGHQETEGKGNVHTGAKPPWLTEEEDGSKQQIGPSYEEFLKHKEKQKLKKLPVERVGANFDHTSQTSESWLPSFGRVWNHGRRWQSRHQFRTESGEKKKKR